MSVINVADLFREENMKKMHKFEIGSSVTIKNDPSEYYWIDEHSESIVYAIKNNLNFFVVEHTRDCDGTPLYTLSLIPFPDNSYDDKIIDSIIFNNKKIKSELSQDNLIDLAFSSIKIKKMFIINCIDEDNIKIKE